MTTNESATETPSPGLPPVSVEQAVEFMQSVDDATLLVEIGVRHGVLTLRVPDGSRLRLNAKISDGLLVAKETSVTLVDDQGDEVWVRGYLPFLSLNSFKLLETANRTARLVAHGHVLIIPLRLTLLRGLPLEIAPMLKKLAAMTQSTEGSGPSQPTKPTTAADEKSMFHKKDYKIELKFRLKPGSALELNKDTKVSVAEGGNASVTINGVKDYTVAIVTGKGVVLNTAVMETGPSEVDMKVTMNRKPNGMHFIAFNPTILHDVQFKTSDFAVPPLKKFRIDSKDYDFVITINPNDEFTVQMLIDNIYERIGNPELVAKLTRKFKDKAAETAEESTGEGDSGIPSEITIDSARWNIVDYVTHEFKGVFAHVKDMPHIRKDIDDPAIQKVAKEGAPQLQLFVVSTNLQMASSYDLARMSELVRLALTPRTSKELITYDSAEVEKLLNAIGVSEVDSNSFLKGVSKGIPTEAQLQNVKEGKVAARDIEKSLHELGNVLNHHKRAWLRDSWIDAGGLESDGRAYALTANLVEAVSEQILADDEAPESLKHLIREKVPTGHVLDEKIALGAVNVRGAIWAAQGVLKDGWAAVSENLETTVRRLYGESIAGLGTKVIRDSAQKAEADAFVPGSLRSIGDGEEFFQQIMHLLMQTEEAFSDSESKGTIVCNYWSFEASYDADGKPNVWALKVAHRLKDLAMSGFTVSIVVDEKNTPSREGQKLLRQMSIDVKESGKGVFQVHAWLPSKENFATGTHCKYMCTPIGVIAGGSNLSDHYAHWTDSNFLLFCQEAVRRFAEAHSLVLQEQRQVGHKIENIADVEPLDPELWKPLDHYDYHGHDTEVYDSDWQQVGFRVFRDQGGDARDRILVECIAVLDTARGVTEGGPPPQTVYIANCYVVVTQPLRDHPLARAMQRALKRGVNIEILSNTKDSIDVPVMAAPVVKSMYLIMVLARELANNAAEGQTTGRVTLHLPDGEFIAKDEHDQPEILIHDKVLFTGEIALVKTTNFHPRSFTLEQEILTEMIGGEEPWSGAEYETFIERARNYLQVLQKTPGGKRIKQHEESILAPVRWDGDTPPLMWGPSADLYVLYVGKQYMYCHTFSSDSVDDVKAVESKLDESTKASFVDLMMNIF